MPKNGNISREERMFILKNRYDMTAKEMAEILGRSRGGVLKFLKRNT